MLENMRKQGASLFVWVIFGILIAMFVVSFGPQSVGSSQGCSSAGNKFTALEIGGTSVNDSDYRFAYNMAPPVEGGRGREELALEALIKREILAAEAERRGLRVDDELVDYVITQGEVHYAGQKVNAKGAFYDEEGRGVFIYRQFKQWIGRWGLSVGAYKRMQRRELMASTMARILAGSVVASREEARLQFVNDQTTVTFDAVEFQPSQYAEALVIGDAEIDRYLAAHEAEVKAEYQEALWKGKKQVRVRRVFVKGEAADRAKLVATQAEIAAGRKKLDSAGTVVEGWYDAEAPTLPEPALNEALKKLGGEVGKVSDVIDAPGGFYLIQITDKREGDLTFEQVKRELAEKPARAAWGKIAARKAAEAALAKAQAGKSLAELFPPGSATEASKVDVGDGVTVQVADVKPPVVDSFGPVPRYGTRTPLGDSAEIARALFDELTDGQVAKQVYEVKGGPIGAPPSAVVLQLKHKTLADATEFEKNAEKHVADLSAAMGQRYLQAWLRSRCVALRDKGQIKPHRDLITPVDENGNRLPVTYRACQSLEGDDI